MTWRASAPHPPRLSGNPPFFGAVISSNGIHDFAVVRGRPAEMPAWIAALPAE